MTHSLEPQWLNNAIQVCILRNVFYTFQTKKFRNFKTWYSLAHIKHTLYISYYETQLLQSLINWNIRVWHLYIKQHYRYTLQYCTILYCIELNFSVLCCRVHLKPIVLRTIFFYLAIFIQISNTIFI